MKRISLILASLVLVFATKASAFKGGPFDNGDYSGLLDNSGVYQVSFRFSNGSGFAQFGNNVDVTAFVTTTGGATVTPSATYSIFNRSVIYYKGMTYLGTCYGMVDHERKIVSGVTNGNSDVNTTTTTTTTTGALAGVFPTAATTNLFNNGNVGFPCNTNFNCKITNEYPILRFNGRGELTVINPSLGTAIFTAIATVIAAQAPLPAAIPPPSTVGQVQNYITALQSLAQGGGPLIPTAQQVKQNSDRVPMNVFGSRVFFISQRR